MTLFPFLMPHSFSLAVVLCCLSVATHAEGQNFAARLTPMSVDFRSATNTTGSGQVTAQLDGSHLRLQGDFSGLSAAATDARLHQGPLAIPGPAIAELQVSENTSGQVGGTVELTPALLEHLHGRGLYIQIHSQAAPDGNLRGWLLAVPQELLKHK